MRLSQRTRAMGHLSPNPVAIMARCCCDFVPNAIHARSVAVALERQVGVGEFTWRHTFSNR